MLSDPFLVILCLILLVMLVQLWSVQRVEKRSRIHEAHLQVLLAAKDSTVTVFSTVAQAFSRIDNLLVEKGVSDKLILSDLIVRNVQENKTTTDALPSVQ
mgnify:FL=1